jgi:hypothetical protein
MKNLVVLPLALVCACTASVEASTAPPLYVAANGVDSATCGDTAAPCRTIAQALAKVSSGGSIAVRPGVYGDVNGDAQLSGLGEEQGTDSAVVAIALPVQLYSTHGAAVTIIKSSFARSNVVEINSDNVSLGGRDAGFTFSGGGNAGLVAIGNGISVVGNAAIDNGGYGMGLFSSGMIQAINNVASGNGTQGFVANSFSSGSVTLKNNLATANSGAGFQLSGADSRHTLSYSVASNNSQGVVLTPGPSRVVGNRLSGNIIGVAFEQGSMNPIAPGPMVSRNDIVGSSAGAIGYFRFDGAPANEVIRENNFYGAATAGPEISVGCGVVNNTASTIDVRHNYWGAATGPGPKPADDVCNGSATTAPFAMKPFVIPTN